jgi:hypothetical protein
MTERSLSGGRLAWVSERVIVALKPVMEWQICKKTGPKARPLKPVLITF